MNPTPGTVRQGLPLSRKLPLLITALLVATMATGVAFGYAEAKRIALATARERLGPTARDLAGIFASSLPRFRSTRAAVARDPALLAYLRSPGESSRGAAAAALQRLRATGEQNLPILLTSPTHRPLLVTGAFPPGARADLVRGTIVPGGLPDSTGISPFVTLGGQAFYWTATAVRDAGVTRGYVLELRQVISTPSSGKQVQALIGPDVRLFFANTRGGEWIAIDGGLVQPPPLWPFSGAGRYRRDGELRIAHATAVAGTPWSVVVEDHEKSVLAWPAEFLWRSIVVATLLCLAGAVGVWLLSRSITAPLKELGHAADALARGDYGRRSTLHRADELGVLGQRFNWMADQVEATHEELAAQYETSQSLAQELEEANQELGGTQSRLTSALRHGKIGTWVWYVRESRIWLGDSLMRLLGRDPDDGEWCTPEAFVDYFHAEDRSTVQGALDEVLASGRDYDIEARVPRADGTTHWLAIKGSAERDGEGRTWGVTGACVDVTDRRQLEAQLRHSQKIESIGQLAGGVAHDFNNLLTVIAGNTELLAPHVADAEAGALLGEIRHGCERATALTRQLLTFSRRQVLEPRVVDLNGVTGRTESMLRRLLGEDIELNMVLHPSIPHVRVDPGYLEQVLVNLAVNARDAMPRGGRLTIESGMAELGPEYAVRDPEVTPGRYVRLAVTDTGRGMPPEIVSRVFEPFFTTKAAGEGTGLGLSVVHGIVKQSGGHVHVYSEPGIGTSFKIYLPPERSTAEAGEDASRAPSRVAAASGHVLLVEDEDAVRRLATRALRRAGYTVVEASGGGEALRGIEEVPHPVDLLLTDVVMPGMSGPELADQLRARFPEMKVLFSSGYADDSVFRHGMLEPGADFLEKPYTPSSLIERVAQMLDGA